MNIRNNQAKHNSPLNLSLSQQENTQTLGAARFKPSAAQTERKIACEQGKTEMKDKTSTPKDIPLLMHLGIFWVGMCPGLQIGTPF